MNSNIELFFILLIVFQIKHFLSDFPLQFNYMLNKRSAGRDFIVPLALHSLVHASMTLAIVCFFSFSLWWLAILDFIVHFTIDRIKSGPKYMGRYSNINGKSYWVVFGLDQMAHHFTNYAIIIIILLHQYPDSVFNIFNR